MPPERSWKPRRLHWRMLGWPCRTQSILMQSDPYWHRMDGCAFVELTSINFAMHDDHTIIKSSDNFDISNHILDPGSYDACVGGTSWHCAQRVQILKGCWTVGMKTSLEHQFDETSSNSLYVFPLRRFAVVIIDRTSLVQGLVSSAK